jgi:hypothetical protein
MIGIHTALPRFPESLLSQPDPGASRKRDRPPGYADGIRKRGPVVRRAATFSAVLVALFKDGFGRWYRGERGAND